MKCTLLICLAIIDTVAAFGQTYKRIDNDSNVKIFTPDRTLISQSYQKNDNGVIVYPSSAPAKAVRVEVITNKIMRITVSPVNNFSDRESLIRVNTPETSTFSLNQQPDNLLLSTDSIVATISLQTGDIIFTDKSGRSILQEKSRSFTPITIDGDEGYTIQQLFTGARGEAIYGLGQHQSGDMNYKGKSEVLYQYNTKVSVPFIVSTNNYGILWDNYSLTKYGDTHDYENLNQQFTLYSADGKAGALTVTYQPQQGRAFTRSESAIDYENLTTVKNFPANFNFSGSVIMWEGYVQPKESDDYKFNLYYAGYTKMYINDSLVVPERWRTAWNPNTYRFRVNLPKDKKTKIKLEWKPDGGASYIGLKALPVSDIEQKGDISFWSELGDQIDYYFIVGKNMDDVISGYRTLTGKATIVPKWAMGYWQSRERYKTKDELLTAINDYRKRHLPLDNIVLDWFYWNENAWGSHQFDAVRFPQPAQMVDSVHKLNAHIMISVWPKFYVTTDNFKAFEKNGWMYMQAVKDSVRDWVGKGYIGSFYDAYSASARKLFWQQMKESLYPKGFDAWWMDASEPDILSNSSMDYRKKLMNPTALGSSSRNFNAYALMNAKAIYTGQREADNDRRVFLLTRSAFAGLQHYGAATWSGDIGTRWEDMQSQITAGLNFAMSGIPYWTMDIGGFCVESRYENAQRLFDATGMENEDLAEWRELNARWFQFGSFCPLFRSHGQFPLREIYNIAPPEHPVYKTLACYDSLRYCLMPYWYTLAQMTYHNDYTIMRPLAMNFQNDTRSYDIGDQFMAGNALMVCPVYRYKARTRNVYFPNGTEWYDFYTNKILQGGQIVKVEAPLERIPLFVPAGTVLPIGEAMQYTGEKSADTLDIRIYTGKDGDFTLYEDEGTNYNYEKGDYSTIEFKYNDAANNLTVGERKGRFKGMLKERIFRIILIDKTGKRAPIEMKYDGALQKIAY